MKTYEYYLDGLDCAACSLKIEEALRKIKTLESVHVDFVHAKLMIQTEESIEPILKEIEKIIKEVEPDVSLTLEKREEKGHSKIELGLIILSALLFGASFFLKEYSYIYYGFLLVSYLLCGHQVIWKAFKNLIHFEVFDEFFLMTIATLGAIAIGEYPEAVAVMLFFKIGEYLEELAVAHSKKSITDLMDLKIEYANMKKDGHIVQVNPSEVEIDDVIYIKPGERVPLDGLVIGGESSLDTSMLTGESKPVQSKMHMEVLSGSVNVSGVLALQVTKRYEDSTAMKMIELMKRVDSKKANTEKFITKFARYYTPFVVILAFLIAVIPMIIWQDASYVYNALVFLVISCPCALVLSIPLGFFSGIGKSSKQGILVKGSNEIENLSKIKTIVFDKTGTLTHGKFQVAKIVNQTRYEEEEFLHYIACAEEYSIHPIALAVKHAYGKPVQTDELSQYQELSGYGVKVKVLDKEVMVGNESLLTKHGIWLESVNEVGTILHVAIDSEYAGYIVIRDEIKPDVDEMMKRLKKLGVKRFVVLSGDNENIVKYVCDQIGIKEYYANLLPKDKVDKVEEIEKKKKKNEIVAFVGDGMNDAPVIRVSDVGISMGGIGSDAAIEASDVVLMADTPSSIATAMEISKKTKHIIWQNIVFAIAIKLVVLGFGAFGLLSIWFAVFADVGVTVLSVMNSMRILK